MKKELETKKDQRGNLTEIFKVPGFGQVHYVTAKPGATRGGHYHTRKQEKFCLIEGQAKITMKNRETSEKKEITVSQDKLEVIDIPINWSHIIKNIGDKDFKLLAWTNEVFDPQDPDTYSDEI
jgi:UDP-2-acetamido-2,6-beta-L-arabino-hexul-4-ose reductase